MYFDRQLKVNPNVKQNSDKTQWIDTKGKEEAYDRLCSKFSPMSLTTGFSIQELPVQSIALMSSTTKPKASPENAFT